MNENGLNKRYTASKETYKKQHSLFSNRQHLLSVTKIISK